MVLAARTAAPLDRPVETRPDLDELSDARLVATVAHVVSQPRAEPADSFILHAPLELAARTGLLAHVAPTARDQARRRIVTIADQYEAFSPPVPPPARRDFESPTAAARELGAAIDAGDLEVVDEIAAWLGRSVPAGALAPLLADALVPRLAAAGHAPILLWVLPRVAPRGELPASLLRPLARELARQPTWRVTWPDQRPPAPPQAPEALFDAIRATPRLGVPSSDFIYPVVSQVERTGVAAALLGETTGGVAPDAGARQVLRAAAWSMLDEPDDYAPYGWTHCLTLPQAVLGVARDCRDPGAALAVAATYVVAFRATMARRPLDTTAPAAESRGTLLEALEREPADAAATVWHAPTAAVPELTTELATRASVQGDAHLVKYTLACLDAADADRAEARLYLAAAASLHTYWARRAEPEDPPGA